LRNYKLVNKNYVEVFFTEKSSRTITAITSALWSCWEPTWSQQSSVSEFLL
jgi:hypothetical protein